MHQTLSKQLIKSLLPENPIIIEAGGHKGRDTVKLAKLMPNAVIYSFEPVPDLFLQLKEATKDYPQVQCFNYALGNRVGLSLFYTSGGSSDAASSLLKPELYLQERPAIKFYESQVPTLTLNQWAKINGITQVDFMWLDMQGGEQAALMGAGDILKTVSLIYTEVNYTQRYQNHLLFDDYKMWLELQGFSLIGEEKKKESWGNALFERK